jgi:hypothetical protein
MLISKFITEKCLEIVNELSGKFSRFTQTIGCSVDNYLLDDLSISNFCDVDSCN